MSFDLDGITEETLAAVIKAQTTGLTASTGIVGVDLSGLVSLVPVVTPFRNMLARKGAENGAKTATWRALLNVTNQQPSPFPGYDSASGLTIIDEQDVSAPYVPVGMAYRVTQDAMDVAKGYAEAKAIATLQALLNAYIGEDRVAIGGQAYALPIPGTPTVTQADTGGSIAASTAVNVKVACRSGYNYFYGGSGAASAQGTVTTSTVAASTHAATASIAAVKGCVAYDWFVGGFYYTTTSVATVTITSIPTAAQALPSSTSMPDLSNVAPTTPPTADTSFSANQFNGLLASTLGDYGGTGGAIVTPGSGTASGASFVDAGAATLTLSGAAITQIDTLLMDIYQQVKLSPDALMMNAQQAQDLTNKLLATSAAYTLLGADDANGRSNIAGGGYIKRYVSKTTGAVVPIEVHPSVPQGTIIARTDRVPFPGSNITNVFEMRTLRDYSDFQYGVTLSPNSGPSGPRFEGEVRSVETFVHRAPVTAGVLTNVSNG
ncbi:MAG: hypothetical protein ACYDA6_00170 [Solirubrobacteraceae bacterium]